MKEEEMTRSERTVQREANWVKRIRKESQNSTNTTELYLEPVLTEMFCFVIKKFYSWESTISTLTQTM